jgi:hypothetical protein
MSERERLVFQCVADNKNGFEESKGRGAGEVKKKKLAKISDRANITYARQLF